MRKILFCILALALSACDFETSAHNQMKAEQQRLEKLKTNPEVTNIGEFEGCVVKYVNRGERNDSFYLAKCSSSTTITNTFEERVGKSLVKHTRLTISQ